MQRYFSSEKINNSLILSKDDIYHIEKVMRMKIDDLIEVIYNNNLYICKITSFSPFEDMIIEEKNENNESNIKISIVQSLVNEQKMDYILQKCTELGSYNFYGYKATNSIIKENVKIDKKIMRWQKIVKEASEQSKRNIIPEVVDVIDINKLCALKADLKILLSVNEVTRSMKNVLQSKKKCDTMIIVVGPEGGFTKDEEEKLINNGFISTSLGPRVLRTETAGVSALAMINYEWMV